VKRLLPLALLALAGCVHNPPPPLVPDPFLRAAATLDDISRQRSVWILREAGGEWKCSFEGHPFVLADTLDGCVRAAVSQRFLMAD
jgi:hypothetical protein